MLVKVERDGDTRLADRHGPGTIERAHGRWRGILPALGITPKCLNGKHNPCPACGGTDRFRFTDRGGDGEFICSQCGAGKGLQLLMKVHGWDFRTAAKRVDEIVATVPARKPDPAPDPARLRAVKRRLWLDSKPVCDADAAGQFLIGRGLAKPWPAALRYVPAMRYQDGDGPVSWHPGMLALVSDAAGKPVTIHRTYLTGTGGKADVSECRKLMPGTLPKGVVVRLAPETDELGVAEGIETALAAARLHGVPCWAALTEGFLRTWEPPAGVFRVVVFGDNDANYVGQAAAHELARRLAATKQISVEVCIPPNVGDDWNDVLMNGMERVAC